MAFGKTKKLSGPKSHSPADCEQATAFVYIFEKIGFKILFIMG